MPNERISFWGSPGRWPRDAMGWVFLARATLEVAECLFGEDWTGDEPTTLLQPPFNTFRSSALPWQKQYFHLLLEQHRPDFGRGIIVVSSYFGPQVPEFSDDEWMAALTIAKDIEAARVPKVTRFLRSQHAIRDALADGVMVSALRPKAGGAFSVALPAAIWNTEKLSERFSFCQMNPSDPFGMGVAGDRYQYIYLSRHSLDNYLAAARRNRVEIKHTISAETQCRKWLGALMAESPAERPQSKAHFFNEAHQRFGIAQRAFNRAWGNAVVDTGATAWVKGGAPKKTDG